MDEKKRNKILKLDMENGYRRFDLERFEDLDVEDFKTLLDEKFVDPQDKQNSAPTAMEFYRFMQRYPSFKAHGYAVSKNRTDYRISIEGVQGMTMSSEALQAFVNMFGEADTFNVDGGYCYCWYD
jgi:hypothetical protein